MTIVNMVGGGGIEGNYQEVISTTPYIAVAGTLSVASSDTSTSYTTTTPGTYKAEVAYQTLDVNAPIVGHLENTATNPIEHTPPVFAQGFGYVSKIYVPYLYGTKSISSGTYVAWSGSGSVLGYPMVNFLSSLLSIGTYEIKTRMFVNCSNTSLNSTIATKDDEITYYQLTPASSVTAIIPILRVTKTESALTIEATPSADLNTEYVTLIAPKRSGYKYFKIYFVPTKITKIA